MVYRNIGEQVYLDICLYFRYELVQNSKETFPLYLRKVTTEGGANENNFKRIVCNLSIV